MGFNRHVYTGGAGTSRNELHREFQHFWGCQHRFFIVNLDCLILQAALFAKAAWLIVSRSGPAGLVLYLYYTHIEYNWPTGLKENIHVSDQHLNCHQHTGAISQV